MTPWRVSVSGANHRSPPLCPAERRRAQHVCRDCPLPYSDCTSSVYIAYLTSPSGAAPWRCSWRRRHRLRGATREALRSKGTQAWKTVCTAPPARSTPAAALRHLAVAGRAPQRPVRATVVRRTHGAKRCLCSRDAQLPDLICAPAPGWLRRRCGACHAGPTHVNIVLNGAPADCWWGPTPLHAGDHVQRRRDLYLTSTFQDDWTVQHMPNMQREMTWIGDTGIGFQNNDRPCPGPTERVAYNTWIGKPGWEGFPQTVREHGVDPAAWVRCS